MARMRIRYMFDALLTAMLVFEMLFQLTGDLLHEVVGVAFFATIVLHLILSGKWMKATAKKLSGRSAGCMRRANIARLVIGVILAVCMIALMSSSLAISNVLLDTTGIDLAGEAYAGWASVHMASSYALCAAVAAHLAVHWAGIAAVFRIPYNRERREAIGAGVKVVAGLGALALGVAGADKAHAAISQMAADDAAKLPDSAAHDVMETQPPTGKPDKKSGERPDREPSKKPDESEGAQNGTPQGICPLCRRRCSLSAPECSRPYAAGLI